MNSTIERTENKPSLAEATSHYFEALDADAASEEHELARHLADAGSQVDIDEEAEQQ